jgi:hypothetical protein
MATRIRIKRGTESQITGYTGPHLEGELAYATTTGYVFVNDGTAFISIGGGGGANPTLQIVTDEGSTTTNSIGIGTTSPSAKLHITGTSESSTSTSLRVENSGNDASFIALDNGTVYSTGPGYDDRNVAFGLESQQYSDTVTVRNVSIGGLLLRTIQKVER